MKTLWTVLLTVVVLLALVLGFVYSGLFNIAANAPDARLVRWVVDTTREHSVKRAMQDVQVPPLTDPSLVRTGFLHYRENCVTCHGAPGVEASEIGQGLSPYPPELATSSEEGNPKELFWIVKNGIKMNDVAVGSFIEAAHRGVKVQIITPGKYIDSEAVRKASRAMWGPMLEAGVEIYEYQPTMYHVKTMIVDDYMVSVGSTNFDDRSFRLNDEANLNIYDAAFAKEQIAAFDDDLTRAKRITLEAWQNRSWREKALEHLASLLRSQL